MFFQVSTADIQNIQILEEYNMLTVTGIVGYPNAPEEYPVSKILKHFSSTFYIKVLKDGERAIILFHNIYIN